MPIYNWKGSTSGTTGQNWGFTGNWLNSVFAGATAFPKGGDTVVFGASAVSCCLIGGLSGGYWIGYTAGDSNSAGDIIVRVDPRYGVTHPNNVVQVGYSFGSVTGGLQLKVSGLYIGTTADGAEISINNSPATSYALAQVDGITATFYASGTWKNVVVNRGSIHTQNVTADLILLEGVRGTTYYYNSPEGYGVNKVTIDGPSDIGAIIVAAKATRDPITINTVAKVAIFNAMGLTGNGATFTTVTQNIRPAGMERQYNRITRTSRFYRG